MNTVVGYDRLTEMWMWRWLIVAMMICLACQSTTNNCGHNPLQAMMEIANNTGMLTPHENKFINRLYQRRFLSQFRLLGPTPWIFTARCYAERGYEIACMSYVCHSVCPSVWNV